jgi:hypothetical protein
VHPGVSKELDKKMRTMNTRALGYDQYGMNPGGKQKTGDCLENSGDVSEWYYNFVSICSLWEGLPSG